MLKQIALPLFCLLFAVGCRAKPKAVGDDNRSSTSATGRTASMTAHDLRATSSPSSDTPATSSTPSKTVIREELLLSANVDGHPLRMFFAREDNKLRVDCVEGTYYSRHAFVGTLTSDVFHVEEVDKNGKFVASIAGKKEGTTLRGKWHQGDKTSAFVATLAKADSIKVVAAKGTQWVGAIGNLGQVRIKMDVDPASMAGVYRYTHSNSEIALKGTVSPEGNVHLEESVGDKTTGIWEGALLANDMIVGRWYSPDKTRTYPFSFHTDRYYPSTTTLWDAVQITPDEHYEATKTCWRDTVLPKISGMTDSPMQTRVNALFEKIYDDPANRVRCVPGGDDSDPYWAWELFSVTWKKKPYVQLGIDSAQFSGGAHESAHDDCPLIDTEHAALVNLHSLIAHTALLHDFVNVDLRRQYASPTLTTVGFFDEDIVVSDTTHLCLVDDHVEVMFEPYEIASWATGEPRVKIPASSYASIFDTESPVGKVLFAH